MLHSVTRLAALFHDLGKATVLFQKKLRGLTLGYEPLRHELISYLMLYDSLVRSLLESTSAADRTDATWLKVLTDHPHQVGSQAQANNILSSELCAAARKLATKGNDPGLFPGPLASRKHQLLARTPLLAGVMWLVLSHHRLPGYDEETPSLRNHVNKFQGTAERETLLAENLTVAPGVPPWQDERWLQSVQATAQSILTLREQFPSLCRLDAQPWILSIAHLARPALVMGDYLGSILKQDAARPLSECTQVILANTRSGDTAGDSLVTHHLSVRQFSDTLYRIQHNRNSLFRTASLSATSLALAPPPARFAWQKETADALQARIADLPEPFGFFGVIIAGTGSGKTLAAPRLMQVLSRGQMRYSLLLGTRALTLQAGRALREKVGFSSEDAAVAVGGELTLPLERLNAMRGSEALAEAAPAYSLDYTGTPGEWRAEYQGEALALFKKTRALDMVDAPVVIATIDHLIRAVEMTRSAESLMNVRLLNADLVLDEIDMYGERDLVSIGKLIFTAGLHGRKVLLMSATLSPSTLEGLWRAYDSGRRVREAHLGHAVPLLTMAASDRTAPLLALDAPDFPQQYGTFVETFLARVEATPPVRNVEILELPTGSTQTDIFETILSGAARLHAQNCIPDPATGKRLSIGFVRFNTARTAWDFARHLADRDAKDDACGYRVLSYHARQPLLMLHLMDSALGRILDRNNGRSPLQQPEIRALLDGDGRPDVMVIVSTTSLQETGRDHDYDWLILEPHSPRSAIQAGGRGRRHRPEPWSAVNILILSSPLRPLLRKTGPVWGMPGIERVGSPYRITRSPGRLLSLLLEAMGTRAPLPARPIEPINRTEDALPIDQWRRHFSAGACLRTPGDYAGNRVGAVEQAAQRACLLDSHDIEGEPRALLDYLSPTVNETPLAFYGRHADQTRFRRSSDSRLRICVFFNPEHDGQWQARHAGTDAAHEHLLEGCATVSPLYPERFWLDLAALAERALPECTRIMEGSQHLHQLLLGCEVELPNDATQPAQFNGLYHPDLGFRLTD